MRKRKDIISVLGLGYVGLPIFLRLQVKYQCVGFDIDKSRIDQLKKKMIKILNLKKRFKSFSRFFIHKRLFRFKKKYNIHYLCTNAD